MRSAWLVLFVASGCAATLPITRTVPPALGDANSIAVAASGPYASELIAGVRARVGARAKVESCVVGCPAVGLYASLALTPGPHEGRVERTCQAEVYTGKSWLVPETKRGDLVVTVRELSGCLDAITRLLLEPRVETTRVALDARGALEPIARKMREGRLDEARVSLAQLVADAPGQAGAWYDLGVVHEAQGRLDDARGCYSKARALAPDDWLARQLAQRP
ncbi:MAG: tetratricopeptide repeat protein [Myxococcaceae bacterium]|nr:tetratricopeptide repeat protein [Myxococcaceae bacterium]